MKYRVERNNKTTAYLQLYMQLRKDITDDVLKYGAKLPSKRSLASDTGVSVITIEHAYELLLEEGYIESRQRSGYYVCYKRVESFPVAEEIVRHVDNVNIQKNGEIFPFTSFAKTMRKVISDYGNRILLPSENKGVYELRKVISDYLIRSRGINAKPNQIFIGSGSEYMYGLIVQFFGNDIIYGIEDPSYEKIRKVYEMYGANCEQLKMGKDGIYTTELERTKAKILHVTPFNSYPSGITATATKKNEYVQWAEKENAVIVEDDFDSEFSTSTKPEDSLYSMSGDGKVIYMNTFSRTIAPSMRLGYLVIPNKLLSKFEDKLGFYSCTVPTFDQLVLTEFISSGEYERHINRVRRKRRQEKAKKYGKV